MYCLDCIMCKQVMQYGMVQYYCKDGKSTVQYYGTSFFDSTVQHKGMNDLYRPFLYLFIPSHFSLRLGVDLSQFLKGRVHCGL